MEVYFRKLPIVVLIFAPGIRQSMSASFCITCSTPSACTGCNINADVTTVSNTSWFYNYQNPAIGTPYLEADLQFTAYSFTTTTSVAGNCVTHTSSPVNLITGYIVPIPDPLPTPGQTTPASAETGNISASVQIRPVSLVKAQEHSESNARYSTFLNDAYSSFYEELGYEGCAATIPPSQTYPLFIGRKASTSKAATPAATPVDGSPTTGPTNPPESSGSVQRAETTRIIILSVVLPTTALGLILICFIVIRMYRKKRSQAAFTKHPETALDVQLYVDQKAELEDEQRRRHELDAGRRIYEMEGVDGVFEMPGNGDTGVWSGRSGRTQELRGAEYSKELEAPGDI